MVDARLPDGSRVNVGRPPARDRRAVPDHPEVRDGPVHGRRPHQLRHAGRRRSRTSSTLCVRGRAEHRRLRRYRYREDDAAQRRCRRSSPTTSASSPSRTRRSSSSSRSTCCSLEARPPNIEGKGEVTIRDLVRNALRMRPDRIVVGEVRGAEALDMLQAMNTGHDGSLTTVHSNAPRDTLSRIETMTLMAGMELPVRAIREQMASALDLDRAPQPSARRHPSCHARERGDGHGRRRRSSCRTSTRSTSAWASTRTASSSAG